MCELVIEATGLRGELGMCELVIEATGLRGGS